MEGIATTDGMLDGNIGVRACPKTCLRLIFCQACDADTLKDCDGVAMMDIVCSMLCAEGFDPALVSITVQNIEGTCRMC